MNPMNRTLRPVSLVLALIAAASCSGSDHDGDRQADEYITACEQAQPGMPSASDETYRAFIEAEAAGQVKVDDARAPALTEPASRLLRTSQAPDFAFTVPSIKASAPYPARAAVIACRAGGRPGIVRRWWNRLSWEGTAFAHCPAFSGENYLFRLFDPRHPERVAYEAVLSVTKFSPDFAIWRKKMDGRIGQDLTLTLMRAVFSQGRITEGPFVRSVPSTFVFSP